MNLTWGATATFGLLALAICSVWIQPQGTGNRLRIAPWMGFFAASIASGFFVGYLQWQAVVALASFVLVSHVAATTTHNVPKVVMRVLMGVMVLALYMHRFPGFKDATLVADMTVSMDARPFTHSANFGAISTGLILLALFCKPVRNAGEWRATVRQSIPIGISMLVCVLGLGMALGLLRVDVKASSYTAIYLVTNWLFTCVAEEAFFRGFIQEQLTQAMSGWRIGAYLAAFSSAILFGIAHAKGGPNLILLASIAGLFNAYAYLKTRRVEASILTHFMLNAIHFVGFSYPIISTK